MEGWTELKIKRKNVLNVGGKGEGNVMEDMTKWREIQFTVLLIADCRQNFCKKMIMSSLLDILTLRCLLEIQVEIPKKLFDIWLCSSKGRVGL